MNGSLKLLRIKKRRDFVAIQTACDFKFRGGNILLLVKRTNNHYLDKNPRVDICRNGIVATKKISKRAVVRNRIKRLIRELIRLNQKYFLEKFDYEFIAQKNILKNNFWELGEEIRELLEKMRKVVRHRSNG